MNWYWWIFSEIATILLLLSILRAYQFAKHRRSYTMDKVTEDIKDLFENEITEFAAIITNTDIEDMTIRDLINREALIRQFHAQHCIKK